MVQSLTQPYGGIRLKPVLRGAISFVPGLRRLLPHRGTGGTNTASYCYGVWLKHLTFLHAAGYSGIPKRVAELGPGDSLGVGLAALLSGADTLVALDAAPFADLSGNLKVFEDLIALFRRRAPRPTKGWPDFDKHLDEHFFPSTILTDSVLDLAMATNRLEAIRRALKKASDGQPHNPSDPISIRYVAPWQRPDVIEPNSIDFILSHSVLEHVDDLDGAYSALRSWLAPDGWMSHQIDFRSHEVATAWNGHWAIPDWLWRLTYGKRPFLINRQPVSIHLILLERHRFTVHTQLLNERIAGSVQRSELTETFSYLSDRDLHCPGAFIQASRGAT